MTFLHDAQGTSYEALDNGAAFVVSHSVAGPRELILHVFKSQTGKAPNESRNRHPRLQPHEPCRDGNAYHDRKNVLVSVGTIQPQCISIRTPEL